MHYLGLNQVYSPAYKLSKLYTLHANTDCSIKRMCRDKHLKAQADSHVVHYNVTINNTKQDWQCMCDLYGRSALKAALEPLNPQMGHVVSCRRSKNHHHQHQINTFLCTQYSCSLCIGVTSQRVLPLMVEKAVLVVFLWLATGRRYFPA